MKLPPSAEGTAARMIEVAMAEVGYVETPDNASRIKTWLLNTATS